MPSFPPSGPDTETNALLYTPTNTQLNQVDSALSRLYDSLEEGTLMAVVCQGSMSRLLALAAKKTEDFWVTKNEERGSHMAGSKRKRTQGEFFWGGRGQSLYLCLATTPFWLKRACIGPLLFFAFFVPVLSYVDEGRRSCVFIVLTQNYY